MTVDLEKFLSALGNRNAIPSSSERVIACNLSNKVYQFITSPEAKSTQLLMLSNLEIRLKNLNPPDEFTKTLANWLLYAINKDQSLLIKNIKSSFMAADDIESRIGTMNSFSDLQFNMKDEADFIQNIATKEFIYTYWNATIDLLDDLISKTKLKIKKEANRNSKIIIMLQQFLLPPHAPTKDACEYAYIFATEYNLDVMIVNTFEHSSSPISFVIPAYKAHYLETYSNCNFLDIDGAKIKYFQPKSMRFSEESIVETFKAIEEFDPSMVLVIGGRNLIAEKLSSRAFTVTYPTSAGVPLLKNSKFFMWREPNEAEISQMSQQNILDKFLFAQYPGFSIPLPNSTLTRSQYDIPEEAFVFVIVGTRLDSDVSYDFLKMLKLIAANPKAHFVFAGNFYTYKRKISQHSGLEKRTSFIGFHADIGSVYSICDAFLNPRRHGGGSAIVYALAHGLPSLSCPFGDAYEAVRDFERLDDYDSMATEAIKLIQDPDIYQRYVSKAKEVSNILSSKRPLVSRIIEAYEEFYSRKAPTKKSFQ